MTDGPPPNPRPLDYRDGFSAATDTAAQGTAGQFSIACFVLFALACGAAMAYMKLCDVPNIPWGGIEAMLVPFCAGLILLPLGTLTGLIGIFDRTGRRSTAVVGFVLNGASVALALILRFR